MSTGSQANAALRLAAVTQHYAGGAAPVLRAVDLELARGTTTLLRGANGTGKTTLLRLAAGLLIPDSGAVTVAGRDVERERAAAQREIGLVTAGGSGLYARLSVRRHLEFWTRLALVSRRTRSAAIATALERFGLSGFADRRVDRLSQGQRQRARLALAFVHGPALILLDEPRTSLDAEGARQLATAVEAATAAGTAVLWAAPDAAEGDPRFDRRFTIASGSLAP